MTQTFTLGDLRVDIDGIDLRDIQWRGVEAIRRIYPVFQDHNWTNRPFRVAEYSIDATSESVKLVASGTGSFDAEPLQWRTEVHIDVNGIDYRFTAETKESFQRNRLGMCVLHPMSAAGRPCRVEQVDGTIIEAAFPSEISPHQPFVGMRAITHEVAHGSSATVRMLGETFEMEDHRNWTDASFKTYCTPISLPFPVDVDPGFVIEQGIMVTFESADFEGADFDRGAPRPTRDEVSIDISDHVTKLPQFGTRLATESSDLTEAQTHLLSQLQFDHFRIDLDPVEVLSAQTLANAARSASRVGSRLRVSTTCDDPSQLRVFSSTEADIISLIDCWYVFSSTDKATPAHWADEVRSALGPRFDGIRIGGGTDLYFTELNREPPNPWAFEVLNFSINPQVHTFDDRTLIQNTMTQEIVAQNASRLTEPAELSIGPITLRPRFNPNATDIASDLSNTPLPSNVDARQRTYFAANWAAMSIKYLASAECVDVATYFEAIGWQGLMESPAGSLDAVHFPSTPNEVFPVWEVFAALSDMSYALTCTSSAPEQVDALVVSDGDGRTRALIANWTDQQQSVALSGYSPVSVTPLGLTVIDLSPTPH